MRQLLGKVLIALLIAAVLVVIPGAPKASAFSIGAGDILNPWQTFPTYDPKSRHESITVAAIEAATLAAHVGWHPTVNFETDIVRGVQNTDITHQFDCDSHFDNSTVRVVPAGGQSTLCTDGKGNFGFDAGFATLGQRLQAALDDAKGNPEFLNPSFMRFNDIVGEIRDTLQSMVNDQACSDALACPQDRLLPVRAELAVFNAALLLNPNPDPLPVDGDNSIFAPGPVKADLYFPNPLRMDVGTISSLYIGTVQTTLDRLNELLGPHWEQPVFGCGCQKTLAESIGSEHPLVKQLQKERNEVLAYLAFQNLGHVFHTTEDFFAHSNYVELMASDATGKTILPKSGPVLDIANETGWAACDPANFASCTGVGANPAIPATFDAFTLAGIQAMLSPSSFANLQSGAVVTRWLGDGDYCGSSHSAFNPILGWTSNPITPSIFGYPLPSFVVQVGLPPNPDPPPGFDFCHYQTATVNGLNKDEPIAEGGEDQQKNHAYAVSAATRMAGELWSSFLGKLTPTTTLTSNPTPVDGTVTTHQTTLSLNATTIGPGIASITYVATGANPFPSTVATGSSAQVTISNPGDTELHYFATDTSGVREPVQTYVVKLRSSASNGSYKYKVIATADPSLSGTATSGFRSLGIGPSINDWGEVGYTGTTDAGSGIYLADSTGSSRAVNPGWATNPSRRFEDIVTLSNGDAMAVGDRVTGSPPSYRIRIWDARPGVINTYQTIDASSSGSTSAATVTFDPGFPGVPAAGIVGMMAAQPAGFTLAPGTSTPGNGFDSVVTPTMNDNGVVAWAGLNGNQWQLASSTPIASGVAGQMATSAGQWSGVIRQTVTDDGHIIARASGDAPAPGEPIWAADAPLMMWDTGYGSDQTIICQSLCDHPGFTAVGRFAGANQDSSVIAFAATGPQGSGIYASVRAVIGGQPTGDGRIIVPIAMTSSVGPISQIEGAFRVAVNSTQTSGERAVEIAFMARGVSGDKGIWVDRLRFGGNPDGTYDPADPSSLLPDPPQMVVQQGAVLPGLPGTIGDVWYYDPLNNRSTGDLAFWVNMTTGTQAIIRARPQCGSTDYAPGTEVDSQYIQQYNAGPTLDLKAAYGQKGGNACGPSSLSMAINNIQRARHVARPGKMANLISLYGDGTASCVYFPFIGGGCTYNGVMERADGQNIAIQDMVKLPNGKWDKNSGAIYDPERAAAILDSQGWVTHGTTGKAGLDAALAAGKQVVQSTSFGTDAQAYGQSSMLGAFGGGHIILFSGRTPMGDYIVEDPAGDVFSDPTHGGNRVHYGPGICGMYTVYAQSTVAENLLRHDNQGNPIGPRYGLALDYNQTVDPSVALIQVFPAGSTTDRTFNMWVTDSSGNQAGFPAGDASMVSTIPGGTATIDQLTAASPDAVTSDDVSQSSLPYTVTIVNPPTDLQVHVQGQSASASYRLQITRFTGGNETSTAQLIGTVAAGESRSVPAVQAPAATAADVSVRQETPKTIQLAGSDPAARALTLSVATNPTNGTVSAVDSTGNLVYTPTIGFVGSDSFTFTADNGIFTSRPATVSITVHPNTPPSAADGTATTNENQAVPITLTSSAPSGLPVTFAVNQPSHGTVTVTGATATYTPAQYFYGTDSFTYTVSDGFLTSAPANVTVTVTHVNQPPIVTLTAPQSVNEGAPAVPITATVSDPDGDSFTLQWIDSLGNLVGTGTNVTFTADDGPATATVSLIATDSHGAQTIAQATIAIANVAPTVSAGSAQMQYWGLPVALTGTASDPSTADTSAGLNPVWTFGDGTLASQGNSVTHTYSTPGNYPATLTATDKDGGVGSATAGVTIRKRGSSIAYIGTAAAGYGFVTLSARLTDAVDGPSARLAGHRVTFIVGSQAFAAVTDATGTATVVPAGIAPGSYQVVVSFSADTLYLGSTARAALVVSNSAGSATATGLVPASGGTASFRASSTGSAISGTLDYSNGSTVIHATLVAPFGIRSDGHAAWFNGVDSLNRRITVYIEDNGSIATDVFKLSINGVPQTGSGALTGGSLQVVKT